MPVSSSGSASPGAWSLSETPKKRIFPSAFSRSTVSSQSPCPAQPGVQTWSCCRSIVSTPRLRRLALGALDDPVAGEHLLDRDARAAPATAGSSAAPWSRRARLRRLADDPADELLAVPVAVGERRVDEVDAELDRAVQRAQRLVVLGADPLDAGRCPRRRSRARRPPCRCGRGPRARIAARGSCTPGGSATISAAGPTMRLKPRHGREQVLPRAELDVRLEPGRAVAARVRGPRVPSGTRRATSAARDGRVGALARRASATIRPAQYASSSAKPALEAGAEDRDVVARRARRVRDRVQVRAASRAARSRSAPPRSRIDAVPFVVERISVRARGPSANSRGEAPTSKPSTTTPFRSPPTTASSPSSRRAARSPRRSRGSRAPRS